MDGSFSCAVDGTIVSTRQATRTADIDNPARSTIYHAGGRLHDSKRIQVIILRFKTVWISANEIKNRIVGQGLTRILAHRPLCADVATSTVDQNINRAKAILNLSDNPLDHGFISQIPCHGQNFSLVFLRNRLNNHSLKRVRFIEGSSRGRACAMNGDFCPQTG